CSSPCGASSRQPPLVSMSGWWTSGRTVPGSSSPAERVAGQGEMSVIRFRSTRDAQLTAGFGEALAQGLAPDGGLYVPIEWPRVQAASFGMRESLAGIGASLLAPFTAGDSLAASLPDITSEAFDFPAPVVA